jgi:hypothetical protein
MNPTTTSTSASHSSAVMTYTEITNIIQLLECMLNPQRPTVTPPAEKVTIVLDVSGSTATEFLRGMTVLEKQEELAREYILNNSGNAYQLYSYDSNYTYHGDVHFLTEEKIVDFPNLAPGSCTCTHKPLVAIAQNLHKFKPDKVIVYTDGATNSSAAEFTPAITAFNAKGITLHFVAVSPSDQNMEVIKLSEAEKLPGMDVVYQVGNNVASLTIYNRFHHTTPFKGAESSAVDKSAVQFMGMRVQIPIPVFINNLLDLISEHKMTLNWGIENIDFTKVAIEIGKLLSALFNDLDWDHCFINSIVQRLTTINSNYSLDRIRNLLKYGLKCVKKNMPVIYTNVDEHAKDANAKKAEFANATQSLTTLGTTLGASKIISIPKNGVCIIAHSSAVNLTRPVGEFPSSVDAYDNYFVAIDSDEQAVRQAMRAIFHKMGYPDAQRGPSAIFLLAKIMACMYIKGIPLDCNHMIELRKIAIIQASMGVMVSQGKYDTLGCFSQWKLGRLIPMHYSKSNTHLELYTDKSINPLNLPQLIWWALMMSMFGIFTEQLNTYQPAVTALCNEHGKEMNENNFLMIIRKMYENSIVGKFSLITLGECPQSFFTYDSFSPNSQVRRLKNHTNPGENRGECRVNALYAVPNEVDYVNQNGCLFCHYKPRLSDWEEGTISDTKAELVDAMRQAVPLSIRTDTPVPVSVVGGLEQLTITSPSTGCERVVFKLMGPTGCGKTTTRQELERQLVAKGYQVFVVSPDDINKVGGNVNQQITAQLGNFIDTTRGKKRAIILDMCNETQINQTNVFGKDLSDFKVVTIMPNFDRAQDDFGDFSKWGLENLLRRSMHGPNTMFWLNPQSVGVDKCIKVHNAKVSGIMRILNIPNKGYAIKVTTNMDEVMTIIKDGAARHALKLAARPSIQDQMKTLLASNGI